MASLTPLSKGLIGLAVVGAMASAVWHLVLKDRMGGGATSDWQASSTPSVPSPNAAQPTPAPAVQTPTTAPGAAVTAPDGKLSAAENFDAGRKLLANGDFAQARKHLEAAVNAGDGAAAQSQEWIESEADPRQAMQLQAVGRQPPREGGRMRPLLVAALDGFVGQEPGVAAAAQSRARVLPARDV